MDKYSQAEAADLLEGFNQQIRAVAHAAQQRAQLTATGTAARKRVTVTVNAEGAVIDTSFSDNIDDLTYSEIAAAVTEAAQNASKAVAARAEELMAPVTEQRAEMPSLDELIEGMPRLDDVMPSPPAATLAPPNSPERLAAQAEAEEPGFADATDHQDWQAEQGSRVTDTGW